MASDRAPPSRTASAESEQHVHDLPFARQPLPSAATAAPCAVYKPSAPPAVSITGGVSCDAAGGGGSGAYAQQLLQRWLSAVSASEQKQEPAEQQQQQQRGPGGGRAAGQEAAAAKLYFSFQPATSGACEPGYLAMLAQQAVCGSDVMLHQILLQQQQQQKLGPAPATDAAAVAHCSQGLRPSKRQTVSGGAGSSARRRQRQLLPTLLPHYSNPAAAAHEGCDAAAAAATTAAGVGLLSSGAGSTTDHGGPAVVRVPSPNVLIGFQGSWIEVHPASLQMWDKSCLEPYGPRKALRYCVLAPEREQERVQHFMKVVQQAYESCRLGRHDALDSGQPGAVWSYRPDASSSGNNNTNANASCASRSGTPTTAPDRPDAAAAGAGGAATPPPPPLPCTMPATGVAAAAADLQRHLTLSPPSLRFRGSLLGCEPHAQLVVYLVPPSDDAADVAGALRDALRLLAPLSPEARLLPSTGSSNGGSGNGGGGGGGSAGLAAGHASSLSAPTPMLFSLSSPDLSPMLPSPVGGGAGFGGITMPDGTAAAGARIADGGGQQQQQQQQQQALNGHMPSSTAGTGPVGAPGVRLSRQLTQQQAAAARVSKYGGAAQDAYTITTTSSVAGLGAGGGSGGGGGRQQPSAAATGAMARGSSVQKDTPAVEIVLQLLPHSALDDISGGSAYITSHCVYQRSHMARVRYTLRQAPPAELSAGDAGDMSTSSDGMWPPRAVACAACGPPFALSSAWSANRTQGLLPGGPQEPERWLHCCYLPVAWTPPPRPSAAAGGASGGAAAAGPRPAGGPTAAAAAAGECAASDTADAAAAAGWAAVAWADSCGEVLAVEALPLPPHEQGLQGGSGGTQAEVGAAAVRAVAQRCAGMWRSLGDRARGRAALRRLAITRLGPLPDSELAEWQRAMGSEKGPGGLLTGHAQGPADVLLACINSHDVIQSPNPWDDQQTGCHLVMHPPPAPPAAASAGAAGPGAAHSASFSDQQQQQRSLSFLWGPPRHASESLLPGEADAVRRLHLSLLARWEPGQQQQQPPATVAPAAAAPAAAAAAHLPQQQQLVASRVPTPAPGALPGGTTEAAARPLGGWAAQALAHAPGGGGGRGGAAAARASGREWADAIAVAQELHGLATLTSAYQGLALKQPLSGDLGLGWWGWAGKDAHLPLHCHAAKALADLLLAVVVAAPPGRPT